MKASSSVAAPSADQCSRRVTVEHPAGVHHRHAVATRGLVHEVRRDEDGHLVAPRQLDHQAPEIVARDGVDARSRLVEDQQLGLVHHRHCQRQALAHPQRQALGQSVEHIGQAKAPDHLIHRAGHFGGRHMEEACVQHQVLAHAQLASRARRPATYSPRAGASPCPRVNGPAEQPGASPSVAGAGR
jgi:hypothetical protein